MHILVVEDDQRMSELIQRGLEEAGLEVTVVYDGEMALKLALRTAYDLIVSDIILPKLDGLDFCQEIKKYKPFLPVIMLTALGTTDDKVEGFDAGADDYMVKPFEMRELIARIGVLSKRNFNHTSKLFLLKYDALEMNLHTKIVKREEKEIDLTPKEFRLLQYMLENNERVLPRSEIAEKVWDTHFDTGTNFIDVYINYLRNKIDKQFETKLIHTKSGQGFILKKDENKS
ncbi:response regulator transcription factor [Empedobacter brevis]|uniref:response regulator transcription factor n=1 Tax=Empedobacter brevis TaxID=247 RepID=UPI0028A2672A|nr:response regulator transcription factor [Empedobacter brevis]